jgi:hypothetical protein
VFQLTTRDGSEMIGGARVSPSFFATLDGPIVAGRPLAATDAFPPAVVISHRLAQRLFNGAQHAIDAHLVLNSHDHVVIGVAAPDWNVPSWKTDVWQSAAFEHSINPQCCYVQLLGRLKADATLAQANDDVRNTARTLEQVDRGTSAVCSPPQPACASGSWATPDLPSCCCGLPLLLSWSSRVRTC